MTRHPITLPGWLLRPATGLAIQLSIVLAALAASRMAPPDDRDLDAHPQHVGMWDIERGHPWRWAAGYAGVIAAALLLSHAAARGWL